ncbi:MAG TPA: hypothetical protein VJ546_02180 [Bacillales bacterium]|nr:hypothetical protein [Bacillales bacterium]
MYIREKYQFIGEELGFIGKNYQYIGENNENTGEKPFSPTKRHLPNITTYKNDAKQDFHCFEPCFVCGGIHS